MEAAPATGAGHGQAAPFAGGSVVATLSVSPRGEVLGANRRMLELLGAGSAQELDGRCLNGDLLAQAADWRSWQRAVDDGCRAGVTLKLRRVGGGTVEVEGDIWLLPGAECLTGFFIDATMQGQLREAVQRGSRLEALGGLTTGIAHDVNNLLTVLLGNLYLAAEETRGDPKLFKKIKTARDAAKRGSELTRRLLSFARREPAEADFVDPCHVVEELAPLLTRALGRGIELDTRLEKGVGTVRASAAELESAIVNLAINAKDAIETSGRVTVEVSSLQLRGEEARKRGVAPGDYVAIAVSDDGAGIEPESLERVFEPFYSTKLERGGTGLGMSMVRWFSEQAGGVARVASRLGHGTTVTMLLPRCVDQTTDTCARTMPLFTLPGGSERVLVLAGEEELGLTMRQMLEVLGYTVFVSGVPEETFDTLHQEQVDLLIVDATACAGTSLRTLLRRGAALRPGLGALVATDAADPAAAGQAHGAAWLLKPFSLFDFATAVRRTLDGAQDA